MIITGYEGVAESTTTCTFSEGTEYKPGCQRISKKVHNYTSSRMLVGYSGKVSQAPIRQSFQLAPCSNYQIKMNLYWKSMHFTDTLRQLLEGIIKNGLFHFRVL